MKDEEKGEERDFSEIARERPKVEVGQFDENDGARTRHAQDVSQREQPPDAPDYRDPGTGSRILRGCGIAIGIAFLLVAFVFGSCLLA